jgi:hypothetical protein
MVKRSSSLDPTFTDPVRGIGKRARSQSTSSKMAALTLLSFMNVESTGSNDERLEERNRARYIQLNCVSVLDKLHSDNDVSSSVTDDEGDSHEDSGKIRDSPFLQTCSTLMTTSQARSMVKMALAKPSLCSAPLRYDTMKLPPGRPLPLPPKLPKHVVAANPKYRRSSKTT